MLLRSSSTSVLGSLLSSIETPYNRRFSNSNSPTPEHVSSYITPHKTISYNKHAGHPHNLTTSLYNSSSSISPSVSEVGHVGGFRRVQSEGINNSSPISPAVSEVPSRKTHVGGFRRVQSEGNLEGLAATSLNCVDDFNFSTPTNKLARRPPHYSTLEAIPSFSFRNCSRDDNENEEDSEEEGKEEIDEDATENENGTFCDSSVIENLCFNGDRIKYAARGYENNSRFEKEGKMEMYLAIGLGISDFNFADIGGHVNGGSGGGGGWQGYRPGGFGGGGGGDGHGVMMEEHYKKMLDENPGNPLCLRNYAQFLHHTKKDLRRAEEYYCRAILADPTDGDVLCQYAKLVWELHRDRGRARNYFERAVQAAGENSHVQAAYACFLWEIADEDEDRPASDGAKQRRFSLVKGRR